MISKLWYESEKNQATQVVNKNWFMNFRPFFLKSKTKNFSYHFSALQQ